MRGENRNPWGSFGCQPIPDGIAETVACDLPGWSLLITELIPWLDEHSGHSEDESHRRYVGGVPQQELEAPSRGTTEFTA